MDVVDVTLNAPCRWRVIGSVCRVPLHRRPSASMRSSVGGVKHIRTKWLAQVERWDDCTRSATWSWIKDEPSQLSMSRNITRSGDRHRYRPGGVGTLAAPEGLGFVSALSQGPQRPCGSDVFCARHDVRSGLRPARFGCRSDRRHAHPRDWDKLLSFNIVTTTARPVMPASSTTL